MIRIYYSSELAPTCPKGELERILRISRDRNGKDDITGMLIMNGSRVMQFLEGPEAAVEACYGRISKDPRHVNISRAMRTRAEKRAFTNWSMGCQRVEDFPPSLAAHTRSLSDISNRLQRAQSEDLHWERQSVAKVMTIFLRQFDDLRLAG